MAKSTPVIFRVEFGDALSARVDVLVLKYAQYAYGADAAASEHLLSKGVRPQDIEPRPGEFRLIKSAGLAGAPNILFVGTEPLSHLDYHSLKSFGSLAVNSAIDELKSVRTIGMTLYGAESGLDESECARALIRGCAEAIVNAHHQVEQIIWLERDHRRAERLNQLFARELEALVAGAQRSQGNSWLLPTFNETPMPPMIQKITTTIGEGPRAFVAMPFTSADQEDTYFLGIQPAVQKNGYLCERMMEETFLGSIETEIFVRLKRASVVIADLTGANVNVYLELGYALGHGRPCLLIAKEGTELPFDLRTQKCYFYKNTYRLNQKLDEVLGKLIAQGRIARPTDVRDE